MSLAREVGTGQTAVYRQYEVEVNEQAAQVGRLNNIIGEVGIRVEYLETLLQEARSQSSAHAHLLSGSVPSVYTLEGEVSSLRQAGHMQDEEVVRASSINEELKNYWESALAINASLHERLVTSETESQTRVSPDPETIMRSGDEPVLRAEIASFIAEEAQWSKEFVNTKAELHYFASESLIMRRASTEEISVMKNDCLRSNSELKEMAMLLPTSQSRSSSMEKPVADWKEEC